MGYKIFLIVGKLGYGILAFYRMFEATVSEAEFEFCDFLCGSLILFRIVFSKRISIGDRPQILWDE